MNRKKIILLSITPVLLLGVIYMGYKIWSTGQAKEKLKAATHHLPSIQLRKIDGSIFQTNNLKNTKQILVLNYFNPECDHCQSMVQEMFREQSRLQNVNWLMITSNTREQTKRFADSMNISKLPNVIVLNDTASQFTQAFGTVSVPSFYVYKNGELLRSHSGECSITYLLQQ